jgi:hypothetical protein
LDLVADHKDDMGPYLYWLRTKLKAQGARNDLKGDKQGFGPWVEANLPISRKTADTWANDWAIEEGLMPKPTSGKSSKGSGGGLGDEVPGEKPEYFSVNISLTPSEQEEWLLAWQDLGEEPATRLLFDTAHGSGKGTGPEDRHLRDGVGRTADCGCGSSEARKVRAVDLPLPRRRSPVTIDRVEDVRDEIAIKPKEAKPKVQVETVLLLPELTNKEAERKWTNEPIDPASVKYRPKVSTYYQTPDGKAKLLFLRDVLDADTHVKAYEHVRQIKGSPAKASKRTCLRGSPGEEALFGYTDTLNVNAHLRIRQPHPQLTAPSVNNIHGSVVCGRCVGRWKTSSANTFPHIGRAARLTILADPLFGTRTIVATSSRCQRRTGSELRRWKIGGSGTTSPAPTSRRSHGTTTHGS